MWLHNERFQRLGGGFGERLFIGILSFIELAMMSGHKEREVVRLVRRVRRERRFLLTGFEAFHVYSFARSCNQMDGDFVEVGCYEGGSARLLCEVLGNRSLHLFDTFEGLPKSTEKDRSVYSKSEKKNKKQYACSLESVQTYLKDYKNVSYYKGIFPDSAAPVENMKFSFVHMDVDLYESTKACLEFFYPRMIPGGIMLSHDYSMLAGVKSAFFEFLENKPEKLVELSTTQCFVVKS